MAGEMKSWNELGSWRLLDALLDHRDSTDEDFVQDFLWSVPEDVTDLDVAARDQAYEDAFDRAFSTARQARTAVRKELVRHDKALALLSQPTDRDRPLWRYKGWPLGTAYLQASFDARHRQPWEMLQSAEKARREAERTAPEGYPAGVVFDLRARAWTELAAAYRVNERYREADAALDRAIEYLGEGSGDLGLSARVRVVEASLRRAQRRLPEALELLEEAHRLYLEMGDLHLAGRTLVNRAYALQTGGDPAEAVRTLEEASVLLDPKRDPSLITNCTQALLSNLVDCGEYHRAGELLLESGLGEAYADEPLNLLRLRWVEAKIHAGMDRLDRAAMIFQEVRAGFRKEGLEYVAALAGLDLAVVWLRAGESGRLLPLAIEMCQTFSRLELPTDEALTAVTFLKLACQRGVANVGFVERTRAFLARYQADPGVQFDPEAVLG